MNVPSHEIAAVVPYRDGLRDSNLSEVHPVPEDDIEGGLKKEVSVGSSRRGDSVAFSPIVSVETPFFHLDLQAATKAAERAIIA
jgi:sodium-independent sulfate anion transporter 11